MEFTFEQGATRTSYRYVSYKELFCKLPKQNFLKCTFFLLLYEINLQTKEMSRTIDSRRKNWSHHIKITSILVKTIQDMRRKTLLLVNRHIREIQVNRLNFSF